MRVDGGVDEDRGAWIYDTAAGSITRLDLVKREARVEDAALASAGVEDKLAGGRVGTELHRHGTQQGPAGDRLRRVAASSSGCPWGRMQKEAVLLQGQVWVATSGPGLRTIWPSTAAPRSSTWFSATWAVPSRATRSWRWPSRAAIPRSSAASRPWAGCPTRFGWRSGPRKGPCRASWIDGFAAPRARPPSRWRPMPSPERASRRPPTGRPSATAKRPFMSRCATMATTSCSAAASGSACGGGAFGAAVRRRQRRFRLHPVAARRSSGPPPGTTGIASQHRSGLQALREFGLPCPGVRAHGGAGLQPRARNKAHRPLRGRARRSLLRQHARSEHPGATGSERRAGRQRPPALRPERRVRVRRAGRPLRSVELVDQRHRQGPVTGTPMLP